MSNVHVSPLLRLSLRLDAAASLGAGALTCLLHAPLQAVIGASGDRILAVGLFMLAYGALLAWLGSREQLARRSVWLVIGGNFIWVLASIALTFSSLIAPTGLGVALLLGQAGVVLVLAEMQFFGLRRCRSVQATDTLSATHASVARTA